MRKVNAEQVSTIRRRRWNGESSVELGREFGITSQMVSKIALGTAYASTYEHDCMNQIEFMHRMYGVLISAAKRKGRSLKNGRP